MGIDYADIEKKWQKRWIEANLDKSERDDSKKKFMIIFAYPGVTGYLHVGHLRGYSYVDAIGCRVIDVDGQAVEELATKILEMLPKV